MLELDWMIMKEIGNEPPEVDSMHNSFPSLTHKLSSTLPQIQKSILYLITTICHRCFMP